MKKAVLIGAAAVLALLAGVLVRTGGLSKAKPEPLPAFSLPDPAGRQHSIQEWRGKVLVINFWASWCPPCKKEIPDFVALQDRYGARGLQFIGIAVEDTAPVEDFLKTVKINYPVLIGGGEGIALAHRLGNLVDGVPFTLIVDGAGRIVDRRFGEFSKAQALERILPLLPAG